MTLAELRADARTCSAAALAAVEPARLVAACLERRADSLVLHAEGRERARHHGPILVVGGGKAALGMARAVAEAAGSACRGGLVVVPHGGGGACGGGVAIASGAHPVPDRSGETATARLLAAVAAADADMLVLAVLSGGASALLVAPAAGLALADKIAVTQRLLASSADIEALNTVRKHCSRVKGGGLARAARAAAGMWTLVLSDVAGDDLATIASGPTVPDPTTYRDAEEALARHLRPDEVPVAVREHLAGGRAGLVPETAKPGDVDLERTATVLVGGNRDAVAAAAATAAARGYATDVLERPLTGDASEAGRMLAARLRAAPRDRPVAVVAGGETTVAVRPGGRGGRSQQLALAAAVALAGESGVLLALGTDGIDGPTDAAGACVDGETVARAAARGLDPEASLATTDSHPLLAATGDLVCTGPTGTNVADVVVALRGAC